jgi:predicted GNAT family N-acyltransferase
LLDTISVNTLNDIFIKSPVTELELEEYYRFRWAMLRQPLGLALGSEKDALECDAFHCMAVNSSHRILGVGRINNESKQIMRIRYMAVSENYRGQGVGSMILDALLLHAKQKNIYKCWLNARTGAVAFYEKNAFKVVKEIETDLLIPHVQMEIYLES